MREKTSVAWGEITDAASSVFGRGMAELKASSVVATLLPTCMTDASSGLILGLPIHRCKKERVTAGWIKKRAAADATKNARVMIVYPVR